MHPQYEYIYNKLKDDWKDFPWKIDYIIHIILCNLECVNDMKFDSDNGLYSLNFISHKGQPTAIQSIIKINPSLFTISEDELLSYLGIKEVKVSSFDFVYITKLFVEPITFRCQKHAVNKEKNSISLRVLNVNNVKHMNPQLNDKVDKYTLHHDLQKNLLNKIKEESIHTKNKI